MRLAIWGAGGHAAVVFDAARQLALHEVAVMIDTGKNTGDPVHRVGLPIVYGQHQLARLRAEGIEGMVIAIGDQAKRMALAAIARSAGFRLCTIVHPSAIVSRDVRIGAGSVIFAGAVVQTGTEIGDNAIINTCASVDHDCHIGDAATLGPRVAIGGLVKVGNFSFIGIGTTVINQVVIGRNCIVGAGSVVLRGIPDDSVAYGVPARVVRGRDPIAFDVLDR
jgi:UDP-N-acetylbacillosamine N-acetyltransferase